VPDARERARTRVLVAVMARERAALLLEQRTDAFVTACLQARAQGLTLAELGDLAGVSRQAVEQLLQRRS